MDIGIRADGLDHTKFEDFAIKLAKVKYNNDRIHGFKKNCRDDGIDGIDDIKKPTIIVQAKRWEQNKSLSDSVRLIKKEIDKISNTKEKYNWSTQFKYVLITSANLNPESLKEIRDYLNLKLPKSVTSDEDIIFSETLNELSSDNRYRTIFEDFNLIERDLLKLLRAQNRQHIEAESEYYFANIDFNYFVETSFLNRAYNIIRDERILLIQGPAGIGKTTTCKALGNIFLKSMDCDVIVRKVEDIGAVLELYNSDYKGVSGQKEPLRTLFVVFDDFLGRDQLDVGDRNLSDIDKLFSTVKSSPNLYICLNSRTQIVKTAEDSNDNFRNTMKSNVYGSRNVTLDLSEYTMMDKAKLFRVIFERKMSEIKSKEKREELSRKYNELIGIQWEEVLRHHNFHPRLIDLLVDSYEDSREDFSEYVTNYLNNPKKLYDNLFEKLNTSEKLLLFSILLFDNHPIDIEWIKSSVQALDIDMAFDIENALHRLEGSWIKYLKDHICGNQIYLDFLNPSIVDYLSIKISDLPKMKDHIIKNSVFLHQVVSQLPQSERVDLLQSENECTNLFENILKKWEVYLDRKDFVGEKMLAIIDNSKNSESNYNQWEVCFWELASQFRGSDRLSFGDLWVRIFHEISLGDNQKLKRDIIKRVHSAESFGKIFVIDNLNSDEFDMMVKYLNSILQWQSACDRKFLEENKIVATKGLIRNHKNIIKYTKLYRKLKVNKIRLMQRYLDYDGARALVPKRYDENKIFDMDVEFKQVIQLMEDTLFKMKSEIFEWRDISIKSLSLTDFKLDLTVILNGIMQYGNHSDRKGKEAEKSKEKDSISEISKMLDRPLLVLVQ